MYVCTYTQTFSAWLHTDALQRIVVTVILSIPHALPVPLSNMVAPHLFHSCNLNFLNSSHSTETSRLKSLDSQHFTPVPQNFLADSPFLQSEMNCTWFHYLSPPKPCSSQCSAFSLSSVFLPGIPTYCHPPLSSSDRVVSDAAPSVCAFVFVTVQLAAGTVVIVGLLVHVKERNRSGAK